MDDQADRSALLSALTTEHFVLQTANNSTYAEASARSTLYVMVLSSALVAMGFIAGSDVLIPFAAIVLPAVFVLGIFTVVRLVETVLESQHYLTGIARIRAFYRTLGPEAARHFSPETGRWPEAQNDPALRLGMVFALFGTTASMIAVINNVVAGVSIALVVRIFAPGAPAWAAAVAGIAGALLLTWLFYAYQRWRFEEINK